MDVVHLSWACGMKCLKFIAMLSKGIRGWPSGGHATEWRHKTLRTPVPTTRPEPWSHGGLLLGRIRGAIHGEATMIATLVTTILQVPHKAASSFRSLQSLTGRTLRRLPITILVRQPVNGRYPKPAESSPNPQILIVSHIF